MFGPQPDSVFIHQGLDGLRQTKIADFGLAKRLTNSVCAQSIVGTMPYTCPEIIQQVSNDDINSINAFVIPCLWISMFRLYIDCIFLRQAGNLFILFIKDYSMCIIAGAVYRKG